MYKNHLKSISLILLLALFLSIFLVKEGFGRIVNEQNSEILLKKIDPELLNLQGETSVIIEFSKKPKDYKQLIRSLEGSINYDYNSIESVAIKIKGENIRKLADFEGLIKVHKDRKVKALLHDSAPLISANDVWNLGYTGKDVKVCVIDTGVDYKHTALGSCNPVILKGNVEPYTLESPHPYPASYNYEWTITKPGYTNISVHFVNISLDKGYDFIYIKNNNGNILQNFTGEYRDIWSVSVPGDTIKINLVSDWYLSLYGFYIDKVINGSASFSFENCKKVVAGYDFINNDLDPMDDNTHGTHVTGIISSDDSYSRGIANGTKIMMAKVLNYYGEGNESDVINGIDWCMSNSAKIISMSLGGDDYSGTCDDNILAKAVNNAVSKGTVVVVSAGNDGHYGLSTPACASGAIAVGAIDKSKNVVGFSSKGPELDIVAPGYQINSTIPKNDWNKKSGTSMAAPHVTGVIALMLEANPLLSVTDVKGILGSTSDPVNKCYECTWSNGYCTNDYGTEIPCTSNVTGSGIVNALRAVNSVQSSYPRYYNIVEPNDPSIYSSQASYMFSSSWLGNIDKAIFEFNGANYTDAIKNGNVYSKTFSSLAVGAYNYKWYANDTSNNWNSTELLSFTVVQAPASCSLAGMTNHIYGTTDTVYCSCTGDGITHLYKDGILHDELNNVAVRYSAGTINWICNITVGTNYTSGSISKIQTINKATPIVNLNILPSQTVTYPTQTTTTCSITSLNNEVIPQLFRGVPVSNPDIVTLAIGSYIYFCNNSATQNYTTAQTQKTLIVSTAVNPPVITIVSPQNTTYNTNYVPLTFTINKSTSWIGYSLDNQPNKTILGNVTLSLPNGTHNVIVYANDTVGSVGSSNRVYFSINATGYGPWESIYPGSGGYPTIGLEIYNNKLYALSQYVMYVFDGTTWSTVSLPLSIPTSTVYSGKIYLGGQGNSNGINSGTIYNYDGSNWKNVLNTTGSYARMLGNYSGKLYVGTMFGTPNLYVCSGSCENPASWSIDTNFASLNPCQDVIPGLCTISSYGVFNGKFYLNTGKNAFMFNGTSWKKVTSNSEFFLYPFFNDSSVGSVYAPELYNSNYYVITKDSPQRCSVQGGFCGRVWKYNGTSWNVSFDYSYTLFDLEVYNGRLYVGTANKIYFYDGNSWQLTYNASSGAEYALVLKTWNNKIYVGFGNGLIAKDDMVEPLVLTISSPQNKTYTTSSIPLTFTTNRPVSWTGYSLDSGANVTISGNITLTGLTNGAHNLVLYANDAIGKTSSSSKVYFTVSVPTCTCTAWVKSDCEYNDPCTFCYWTRTCNPKGCSLESRTTKSCRFY